MKTRRTKFLLSFLAVAILGFAMVNAYTFEVTNRDPFGTLNLSTLMIKPDVNSNDTILLSGSTVRIKQKEGKLKVHQICNEDPEGAGEQCIEFGNLGSGGPGAGGITATGTINDYCYLLSDGNLNCDNTKIIKLIGDAIAAATAITPSNETITINRSGEYLDSFTLNGSAKTIAIPGGGGNITISGARILSGQENRICTQSGTDNLVCNLDPSTLGEGGLILGATTNGGYCKYTCVNEGDLDDDERTQIFGDAQGKTEGDLTCVITCTDTEIGSQTPGGSLWALGRIPAWGVTSNYIHPTESNDIMINQAIRNVGAFNFYSYNGTFTSAASHFTFDAKGIRIGDSAASIYTGNGLSVGGIIAAGNNSTDNYIYIYASGNNNDENKHYEIMGNSQLAIGTNGGAFLYFTQKTGTYYPQHLEYLAGPSTNSYTPGYCHIAKSNDGNSNYTLAATNSNDEGEGSGRTVGGGGGGGEGEYTCQPPQGHERSSVDIGTIPTTEVYQSLMVGVNTNKPNATLDVNGSIKVGSNCVDDNTSCTIETAGTIMYVESNVQSFLLICKQTTNGFMWHDLIGGTEHELIADFGVTQANLGCSLPKPTPGINPNVIQQGQLSESYPLQY